MKQSLVALICALATPLALSAQQPQSTVLSAAQVKHVLLISIDGLHALDLTNLVQLAPESNIAQLSQHGIRYTNASTSLPSDSFPGLAALLTGGSPQTTGFWYDVTYNRASRSDHALRYRRQPFGLCLRPDRHPGRL